MTIGENITHVDGVGISPFFHASSGGLVGAIIDFKGFRFVIWLGDHALEDFILETDEGVRFGGGNAAFIYHMEQFNFAIGKIRSQVLQFTWDTTIRIRASHKVYGGRGCAADAHSRGKFLSCESLLNVEV